MVTLRYWISGSEIPIPNIPFRDVFFFKPCKIILGYLPTSTGEFVGQPRWGFHGHTPGPKTILSPGALQERLYHPEFYKSLGTNARDMLHAYIHYSIYTYIYIYVEEFAGIYMNLHVCMIIYMKLLVRSCSWCWFDASFVRQQELRSLETNVSASFSWLVPVPHALRTRQCELGASCKELGCLNRLEDQTLATQTSTICAWGVGNKKGEV